MCGRSTHLYTWQEVAQYFGMDWAHPLVDLTPRYNLAPGQMAPVVRDGVDDQGGRALHMLRWGLIPAWAKDQKIGWRTINARGETAATKPAFRSAFKRRRCVVPVSGFYEWRAATDNAGRKPKQPFYITPREGSLLPLAGLWESWRGGAAESVETLETFTIVTTTANAMMAPLHDRMPVILAPDDLDLWLDPEVTEPTLLNDLLRPAPNETLLAHPVSRRVNTPKHDGPDCIEPLDGDAEGDPSEDPRDKGGSKDSSGESGRLKF